MSNGFNGRVIDTVLKVVVALTVAAAVGLFVAVSNNGDRLTTIEASSFTAEDGRVLELSVVQVLGQINERLARIEEKLEVR